MNILNNKVLVLMAEKGGKRIIAIVTICIILISILFCGCINNENDVSYYLSMHIDNSSSKDEMINVIMLNSESFEIYNKTIEIKKDESKIFEDITNKEGIYSVILYIDDNRTVQRDNIEFNNEYTLIKIRIYDDEIDLGVEVK